ncbi:MAG: hypothetical protein ACLFU6_05650 [Candidatus Hydrogenedentota bacterium]
MMGRKFWVSLIMVLVIVHGPKVNAAESNQETLPNGYTNHAESHDLRQFSRVVEDDTVFLLDEEGDRMFVCKPDDRFSSENVHIDPERGLLLQGTVIGEGEPGTDVPSEHQRSAGVKTGQHYGDEFTFWSFAPDPPTDQVRVDVYATVPRPLGAKAAIWSFADAWYPGGESVISLEMDMIEAGGRPREWVDGSREGMFRYHPNLHCWFGGGSPWGHRSVQHMEPIELDFGPENQEHKLSWEWRNGPTNEEKTLRYLIDDEVVYERCVADLKEEHPKLDRGGMEGVESTMSAKEIAEFMWDKPQHLYLWYGADGEFFLSDTPQYGNDWPSEMVIRRIDVFR